MAALVDRVVAQIGRLSGEDRGRLVEYLLRGVPARLRRHRCDSACARVRTAGCPIHDAPDLTPEQESVRSMMRAGWSS